MIYQSTFFEVDLARAYADWWTGCPTSVQTQLRSTLCRASDGIYRPSLLTLTSSLHHQFYAPWTKTFLTDKMSAFRNHEEVCPMSLSVLSFIFQKAIHDAPMSLSLLLPSKHVYWSYKKSSTVFFFSKAIILAFHVLSSLLENCNCNRTSRMACCGWPCGDERIHHRKWSMSSPDV
jgi:hypothetical protein